MLSKRASRKGKKTAGNEEKNPAENKKARG